MKRFVKLANDRALCLCLNLKNRCSKYILNFNKDKMIQTTTSAGIAQNPVLEAVKEGNIVRYPVGLFHLNVRRVYKDGNGDLYVRECINTKNEYLRYIYRSMDGYKWDTRLCRELGFGLAKESELEMLED